MSSKALKVGDRVKYVGSKIGYSVESRIGKTGEITRSDDPLVVNFASDCGVFYTGVYRHNLEIIEPERTSPIRTVTRREIVPGVYGPVDIRDYDEGGLVQLFLKPTNSSLMSWYTASELREAAHTLNQLAEYLENPND